MGNNKANKHTFIKEITQTRYVFQGVINSYQMKLDTPVMTLHC